MEILKQQEVHVLVTDMRMPEMGGLELLKIVKEKHPDIIRMVLSGYTDMQGESIKPILLGKTPGNWRTSMYYHYYEYPGYHSVKRHYGIRTQRYKLIHFYYDIDCWELYDLKKDPHELNNFYSDPAYAKVAKKLTKELRQLQAQYKDSDELAHGMLSSQTPEN
ncbi:MAG: DUF4976 domain-containing protein [Planctomycetes bacterium]|nr:DUF4976 domain-containing protein [Planctomycetota bacterium]